MDYSAMAQTASRLLQQYGQPITLRSYTVGVYDPSTGHTSTSTADTTHNAVLVDFGQGQTLGPGGLIQVGDKLMYLEAGVAPALEDHVIVGGKEYVAKGIGTVSPSGIDMLYTLHLRI